MRPFLGAVVLGCLSVASCTAILGGVPTSGGTGGAGGESASTGGSTSRGSSTGLGAVGPGGAGGAGGATNTSSNGGAGATGGAGGAGGGKTCTAKGGPCSMASDKCCSGLACVNNRCTQSTVSSSASGGNACTHCDDVLEHGLPPMNFCQMSDSLWNGLKMCACGPCAMPCIATCSMGSSPSLQCAACVNMSCQQEYSLCKNDTGP